MKVPPERRLGKPRKAPSGAALTRSRMRKRQLPFSAPVIPSAAGCSHACPAGRCSAVPRVQCSSKRFSRSSRCLQTRARCGLADGQIAQDLSGFRVIQPARSASEFACATALVGRIQSCVRPATQPLKPACKKIPGAKSCRQCRAFDPSLDFGCQRAEKDDFRQPRRRMKGHFGPVHGDVVVTDPSVQADPAVYPSGTVSLGAAKEATRHLATFPWAR
jgi:hypothetical protein